MPDDVAKWLEELGLGEYAAMFADNAIDADVLCDLTEADLEKVGVKLGHRKKLLKAIATLAHEKPLAPVPSSSEPTPQAHEADETLAAWERHPGERKPVTMLFADITGSTALTEKLDAEETHDLLYGATQRMCEAVEKNRGTVCRFMGDGVMAMFGAPVASEQHAVDACEAALEMQQAVRNYASDVDTPYGRQLHIRVGLHSGGVVVLTVGEGAKVEYDASGPTVPVAARMEQVAQPGEVYLTAATHSLAAHRIETEVLEPVLVKGVSEPISVFALRRVRSAEEQRPDSVRTPFVGRRAELVQFRGMLGACIEEGNGQTIYVRGEPGIGKTRLVEEFARIAGEKGASCHRGLVLPFGVGKGQDAIRSFVKSLLGIPLGSGKAERERVANGVLNDGRLDPDQTVFLNDLLDLRQPTEQRTLYDAMDNATRNKGKQAVVSALVTAASSNQPLLTIVEDVHWADAITLTHLVALTKTVAECPALLVMTSRIEGDQLDRGWRASTEGSPFITIDLGPLRKQDSIALISEFIDSTDPLAKSCLERAAGNPLFLEQLLRTAQEGSVASLPDSIQSLVLARMDRLQPEDKRALQAASIIGQRFDTDILCHLLKTNEYEGRSLVEHNLVRPEGTGYLFAHALIQESVYASLLKGQRRDLHRRAAEWFAESDAVLYAQHLDRAADEGAPRAYLEAARSQSAQYRTEKALQLVEKGLELAASDFDKFELTCFRGELLHNLGRVADSIEAYHRCLDIAEDNTQGCRAHLGLAAGMRIMDKLDEALEILEKAESEAVAEDLSAELARIHHLRGNLYFPMGKTDQCVEQHELALKYAREVRSPELEAIALGGVGDGLYAQGRLRSAHKFMTECIEVSRRHGLGRIEVANQPMILGARYYLNELRTAREEGLLAAELARKVGHARGEVQAHIVVSMASIDLGDLGTALKHTQLGLELIQELGAQRFVSRCLLCQARIALAEGQPADAVRKLGQAIVISRETGIGYVGAAILGTLALAHKDATKREQALREGEEILRRGCVSHNYFEFYEDAMEVCLNIGDWKRVNYYASALEKYTQKEPLPRTDFFIVRGRALASVGHGNHDDFTLQELRRLRDEAQRVGLKLALPAIEAALSSP